MSASASTIPWNSQNRASYGPQLQANGMALSGEFLDYSRATYVIGLGQQSGEAVSPIVTLTCNETQIGLSIAGNKKNCSRFQGYDCTRPASQPCCDPSIKGSLNSTLGSDPPANRGYSWNSDGHWDSETENGPCYSTPGAWKFGHVGTSCVNPECTTADLNLAEAQLVLGGPNGVSPTLDNGAYNFLFASSSPPMNGAGAPVVQANDGSYAVVAIPYDRQSVMASPPALLDWQNNYGTDAYKIQLTWPTAVNLDDYHRMMYDLAMQPLRLGAVTAQSMTTVCPIFAPSSPNYTVLNAWYLSLPQAWREGLANDYCGLNGTPSAGAPTDDSCRCWQAGFMTPADTEDQSYGIVTSSAVANKLLIPGDKNCWFLPCFDSNGPTRFSTPQVGPDGKSSCPPTIFCNNILIPTNSPVTGSVIQQSVHCQGTFADGSGGDTKPPASSPLAAIQAWAKAHWQIAVGLGVGALLILGLLIYVVYQASTSE